MQLKCLPFNIHLSLQWCQVTLFGFYSQVETADGREKDVHAGIDRCFGNLARKLQAGKFIQRTY